MHTQMPIRTLYHSNPSTPPSPDPNRPLSKTGDRRRTQPRIKRHRPPVIPTNSLIHSHVAHLRMSARDRYYLSPSMGYYPSPQPLYRL